MTRILSGLLILFVRVYQKILSPLLPNSCRYEPSCSQYMIEAIREWGAFRGTWLGLVRIVRCNPWGGHGFDPVPKRKNNANKTAKK